MDTPRSRGIWEHAPCGATGRLGPCSPITNRQRGRGWGNSPPPVFDGFSSPPASSAFSATAGDTGRGWRRREQLTYWHLTSPPCPLQRGGPHPTASQHRLPLVRTLRPVAGLRARRYQACSIPDRPCRRVARKRPLNRQAGDPSPRASLGVEQPLPRNFVRLTPLPQVFRHSVRCWPSIGATIRRIRSWWKVLVEAGTCASRFFDPLLSAALLTRSPRDRFGCPRPCPHSDLRPIPSTGNTRIEIPQCCLDSG